MRLIMVLLLGALVPVGCAKTDREENPTAKGENQEPAAPVMSRGESLVSAVKRLHSGMKAESKEERKAALKRILPTEADLETLFPGQGEKLWAMLGPRLGQMVKDIDEVAAELTRHEWTQIQPIDIRQKDDSGRFAQVLGMIPKEIPVFRIVKRSKESAAGSGSYLFVNNRWVHLRGLEGIPKVIGRSPRE